MKRIAHLQFMFPATVFKPEVGTLYSIGREPGKDSPAEDSREKVQVEEQAERIVFSLVS